MLKDLKHRMMFESRLKKYEDFLKFLNIDESSTILDVGVANKEFSPYDNFLEKRYPHKSKIAALSVQDLNEFNQRYPEIKTYIYGGGGFPFKERQFTAVHSNAVIEHVGGRDKQIDFIRELSRCGEVFFFTTPAKEFPIEMHTNIPFLHWLPKKFFDCILRKTEKAWAAGDYMNLLKKKDIENLLRSANIITFKILIHKMGPFPLHYIVWGRSEH